MKLKDSLPLKIALIALYKTTGADPVANSSGVRTFGTVETVAKPFRMWKSRGLWVMRAVQPLAMAQESCRMSSKSGPSISRDRWSWASSIGTMRTMEEICFKVGNLDALDFHVLNPQLLFSSPPSLFFSFSLSLFFFVHFCQDG